MEFALTDAQQALVDRVAAFARHRLAPDYQPADRRGSMGPDVVAALAAEGLLGLRVPARYGGSAASAVETGLVLEQLARADFNACYPVLNAALIGEILAVNGAAEQRARWLPSIADGSAVVALCLTEPEHGSDAAAVELRGEPAAPGPPGEPAAPDRPGEPAAPGPPGEPAVGWRLYGAKSSIMLAGTATHGLVFARTGGPGARGVSAFYTRLGPEVGRTPAPGAGNRSAGQGTLTFAGLPVGVDDLVGGEGAGFVQVMRGFDYSRALISLMCLGTAAASMEDALGHARTRQAFGQPIGRFQGVAFPLVEHATRLHAARLLALEALWRKDAGLDHRLEANMAKWWAPLASFEATHQALLTLGQHGWSERSPLGQRLRDIMGLELGDGTAQITKLVVARLLLGREQAP